MPGIPLTAMTNPEDPVVESPPGLMVYYHEYARRSLPASPENMGAEIISVSPRELNRDSEIYIREDTRVTLRIYTEDFDAGRVSLTIYEEDYQFSSRKEVTASYYDAGKWTGSGDGSWILPLLFREEGHFQLNLSYTDSRGQMLEAAGEDQQGCFCEGTYIGPHMTVDKKDPVIVSMTTDAVPLTKEEGVPCFEEEPEYKLMVAEENFHPGDIRWKSVGGKIALSDWSVLYEGGIRINVATFRPQEEGFYSLTYEIRDGCGRKCDGRLSFLVDRTPPRIKVSVDQASPCHRYAYEDIRLFSEGPMTFILEASDLTSGIESIHYTFRNSEGKVTDEVRENEGKGKDCKIKIALPRDDFCGWISATCTDRMGHVSQNITSPVFLWESRAMSASRRSLKISYSQAEYTDEENRIKYYKEAAVVRMDGGNDYAGVRDSYIKAVFGKEGQTEIGDYRSEKTITGDFHQEIRLSPEDYEESRREEPVRIRAGFTDNAGYETGSRKGGYGIVIDHLSPVITVDFRDGDQGDSAQEGSCYNRARSAVVTVTDWNFNPTSTHWNILGDKEGYTIGGWHGEGNKHWCKVDFLSDGVYRLGLDVSDYSGNSANYSAGGAFTIDRTPPELILWMDQSKACHKKYYSGTQTVYLLMKEENVSKNQIHLYTGRGLEGRLTPVRSSSLSFLRENEKRGWKIYSYEAREEGAYRLSCQCRDKAGNRSGKKTLSPFIIDKTPPGIDWKDLCDGTIYTGKVSPAFTVHDLNLDECGCQVQLYYGDGSRAVSLESHMILTGRTNREKTFCWEDFPLEKRYDNRYLLRISACDLAGNTLSDVELSFCVDRFGARYQLEGETSDFLERYYNKEEQDILLTAYSLHPLETDIWVNYKKEDFYLLDPGAYKEEVQVLTGRELCGDDEILPAAHKGWYQTTYRIAKEAFQEEGDYSIALRSRELEDGRVLTESETILWTGPIEFAIDKTPPSVLIGGLEQDAYVTGRKEYTVTALDNIRLKKVRLSIRKEEESEGKTILLTERDFKENHSVTSELASYEGYQIVGYDAWDYAGNRVSARDNSEEIKVLVTPSTLFHIYNRHRTGLAICLLSLIAALTAGVFLTRKYLSDIVRRKKGNPGPGSQILSD